MNRKLLLLSMVAHIGFASAADGFDRIGHKELPSGAVLICEEHIVGEASSKPVHIDWQAFGLRADAGEIAQFYHTQFGRPSAANDDAQNQTWRFKGEYNELQYSVRATSEDGPWSGCAKQLGSFKSVLLISNAIWEKGR